MREVRGNGAIERNEDEVETSYEGLKRGERGEGGGAGKGGDEEYPRARQHDYEPQLCLRLPAT